MNRLFGTLLSSLAACSASAGGADAPPVDAAPSGGTLSLSWTLSD